MDRLPSLRIITTETRQSIVQTSTVTKLSPKKSSLVLGLWDTKKIYRLGINPRENPERYFERDESSRIIRRSFAFDEYDDEKSFHVESSKDRTPNPTGNSRSSFETMKKTIDDIENELHRAIRRTFAFDEWDDNDINYSNQSGDKLLVSDASFLPIEREDHNSVTTRDKNSIETTANTDTNNDFHTSIFRMPTSPFFPYTKFDLDNEEQPTLNANNDFSPSMFRMPSSPPLPNTKFDLDNEKQSTMVTPSPPFRSRNSNRIHHPYPLYSHQTTTQGFSRDTTGFWYETKEQPFSSTDDNHTGSQYNSPPRDYKKLDRLFQEQRFHAVVYPPQCESIPRQASAFRSVESGNHHQLDGTEPWMDEVLEEEQMFGQISRHDLDSVDDSFFSDDDEVVESPTTTIYHDMKQLESHQQKFIDEVGSIGASFFSEDDEVFESPTTTSSDYSDSSTIPEFIMFCKKE